MDVVDYSKLLIDEQMRTEPQRGCGSVAVFRGLRLHLFQPSRCLGGAECCNYIAARVDEFDGRSRIERVFVPTRFNI
jgi:hypothetical protein